ncbi:ADP-glucose pyrophosphorylase family protein [Striga asiatica]|uniref:ADP-glucose pyrophosphorylase family protein n=1 Tax=Striga asiatica TaxID=4170 RepID=A0A5A7PI38_STRAF|nr:ADP-glucose pyrophosphorylase family protein [Striga asiatica]
MAALRDSLLNFHFCNASVASYYQIPCYLKFRKTKRKLDTPKRGKTFGICYGGLRISKESVVVVIMVGGPTKALISDTMVPLQSQFKKEKHAVVILPGESDKKIGFGTVAECFRGPMDS